MGRGSLIVLGIIAAIAVASIWQRGAWIERGLTAPSAIDEPWPERPLASAASGLDVVPRDGRDAGAVSSRTAAAPQQVSIQVVDSDGQGIPGAELVGIQGEAVAARFGADEIGRIFIGLAGANDVEVERWFVGAKGFDFAILDPDALASTAVVELDSLESAYLHIEQYDKRPVSAGWRLRVSYAPVMATYFEWFEPLRLDADISEGDSWWPFSQVTSLDGALSVLVAPDGCRCVCFASRRVELQDCPPPAPSGVALDTVAYCSTLPIHPPHEPYTLRFLDDVGAPIVDASLWFETGTFDILGGRTDANGVVPVDVWYWQTALYDLDLDVDLQLADGSVWTVAFSTGALMREGQLTFSRVPASLDYLLQGARPGTFSLAGASMHWIDSSEGEPPWIGHHVRNDELVWERADASGRGSLGVAKGTGRVCGLLRHEASKVAVGGLCGLKIGTPLVAELPVIGQVRAVVETPGSVDWRVELHPDDALATRILTAEAPSLSAARMECELPVGEYRVVVSAGGEEWEAERVQVEPGVVDLPIDLRQPLELEGRLLDGFGEPLRGKDLLLWLPGLDLQNPRGGADGGFAFKALSMADLNQLEVEWHGGVPYKEVPLAWGWADAGFLEVQLLEGRFGVDLLGAEGVLEELYCSVRRIDDGASAYLDITRGDAVPTAPGDYELVLDLGWGVERVVPFSVALGGVTRVPVDCTDFGLLSVSYRSSLSTRVDLAVLPALPVPEESLVPRGSSLWLWPGEVENTSMLLPVGGYRVVLTAYVEVEDELVEVATLERSLDLGAAVRLDLDLDDAMRIGLQQLGPTSPSLAALAALLE